MITLPSSTGDSSSSKYNLVGYKYNLEGSVWGHSFVPVKQAISAAVNDGQNSEWCEAGRQFEQKR